MSTPTIYPYRFLLRITHKVRPRAEEHTVRLSAYNMQDAMLQSLYQIQSDLDIDINEYDIKILSCGPDSQPLVSHPKEANP